MTVQPSPGAPLSDDELGAWLHLLHSDGVGRESARRLLAFFGGPQAVLDADTASRAGLVGAAVAARLGLPPEGHALRLANTLAWRSAAPNRRVMVLGDADYPPLLLHSADPPLLLYLLGRAALLSAPSLAIVGSRAASAQGLDNARGFARSLAQQGWAIVSGLAAGIDAAAHQGALDAGPAGAGTIAVIGTGIDRVYPPGNHALARRIAAEGLVVSELAVGTPPLGQNFPQRNRLIAGMSRGTLVVEAALRSGSLITARLAAEAGREVMALPGSLLAPQSHGCHALIRQGAALVMSPEQVLDELNGLPALSLLDALSGPSPEAGHNFSDSDSDNDSGAASGAASDARQASGTAAAPPTSADGRADGRADDRGDDRADDRGDDRADDRGDDRTDDRGDDDAVLRALGHDPLSLDALINRCGWPAAALSAHLMTLELDGKVARLPGGLYQRRQRA